MIVCREAEVNILTRLQSYGGCAISHDVVRRRTTMTQHREKATHMRTCEDMVQTSATSHDVKRGRTTSRDDCTTTYNHRTTVDVVKRSHDHRTRYLSEGRPMHFINIFGIIASFLDMTKPTKTSYEASFNVARWSPTPQN